MIADNSWGGARWWRFDFHTHTPASSDYGKSPSQADLRNRAHREWLLDCMRAGLDCVAITDHNSGAWIDPLKQALMALDAEQPEGYRPLRLFPGVEISVLGGIHVLAIFDSAKGTSDIDHLLGAVGFNGTRGSSHGVTAKAFADVVGEIVAAGGIAIPAHVDGPCGLFTLQGQTLKSALDSKKVFAMEVVDSDATKPGLYVAANLDWTEVLGSDSHHPSGSNGTRFPGSHYTWVKMGNPNIDGLRLALLDGPLSVRRSDQFGTDQNTPPELYIESVEVEQARYMGRNGAFEVRLNPWLNAIIGGRGTGKSTLVEFLRLAFRREAELPKALKDDFQKYAEIYRVREESGLLTDSAIVRVVYRKNNHQYRIQWSPGGSLDPIQERADAGWISVEGDITQRFPVRIYSQKQILHLARDPLALLKIIDEAAGVGHGEWKRRKEAMEGQYLALRAKQREIGKGLSQASRLKGELDDLVRKLALFERSGHADVLKALQRRRRQASAIAEWESGLSSLGPRLREAALAINPEALDASTFDATAPEDAAIVSLVREVTAKVEAIANDLEVLAGRADALATDWDQQKQASPWQEANRRVQLAYKDLQEQLMAEGVADISEFGQLLQRRQVLEQQIKDLDNRQAEIAHLDEQAKSCLDELLKHRREITRARSEFLAGVLQENAYVRITVAAYGAQESVEPEFRRLIARSDGGFERDIGKPGEHGLLKALDGQEPMESAIATFKDLVKEIRRNPDGAPVADRRFASHLNSLPDEALDRLDLWFPEDTLDITYSPASGNSGFRPIREGSPGQKSAALLAFLLSYGNEPLILDQPEDDLDNHLIYDLIVRQLRDAKRRRQIIVVTHNANIVVNGDAELLTALSATAGQTVMEASGSLQELSVRRTICKVMEGGEEAFRDRYRRIALEGRNV